MLAAPRIPHRAAVMPPSAIAKLGGVRPIYARSPMKYKVTALRDVTIRAYVRFQKPERLGNELVMRPAEREEWIPLRAGESREHLGLVLGVHPRSLPDVAPIHIKGVAMVLPEENWSPEQLPREFFGLYRLEVQPPAET